MALTMVAAVLVLMTAVGAQEHPGEHPREHPTQEHPARKTVGLTKEALARAIQAYIQKDDRLKGGYFLVYDKKVRKPLALTLLRVHEDRLSRVEKGLYFACADFKAPEGRLYDLDFFMQEGKSGLDVSEITIHKENGKPRYHWVQTKDGMWVRR